MTPMAWLELRLAVAEHFARQAMQREAEQAAADVALVRALARRRVTQRPNMWGTEARTTWRAHTEIRKSLKSLRAECVRTSRCNTRAQHRRAAPSHVTPERTSCPACEGALQ